MQDKFDLGPCFVRNLLFNLALILSKRFFLPFIFPFHDIQDCQVAILGPNPVPKCGHLLSILQLNRHLHNAG